MKIIKSERGVAAVEFALVAPLLVLLLFTIIEFSLVLYNKGLITNASRVLARVGSVHDANSTNGTVGDGPIIDAITDLKLDESLISLGSSNIAQVLISPAAPRTSGDDLKVTVNYTYDFLVLPDFTSINLSAVTVMKVE